MKKEIDAIKLLELYKINNFSGSGKYESENRNRIDKAILDIHSIIEERDMHRQQAKFRLRMADMKREVYKKQLESNKEN